MALTRRLNVRTSPKTEKQLEQLVARPDVNDRSDAVRQALRLMDFLEGVVADGQQIYLVDPDGGRRRVVLR